MPKTSVLYRKQIRLLERFHQRYSCSTLDIKWQDYVSKEEVFKRVSLPNIHVARMESTRMPRQSSSANPREESAVMALRESVTKTVLRDNLDTRESTITHGSRRLESSEVVCAFFLLKKRPTCMSLPLLTSFKQTVKLYSLILNASLSSILLLSLFRC